MGKLFLVEVKTLVRRRIWFLFSLLFGFSMYFGSPNVEPYVSDEFYGPPYAILFSLGQWGRACLLLPPVLLAVLLSFLTVESFRLEALHREPLWAMPNASHLPAVKCLSLATFVTFLVYLGSVVVFLKSHNRRVFVMEGGLYVLLYLALTWLQAAVWVATTVFLFHLTSSRLVTVATMAAVATILSMAGQWFLRIPNVLSELVYKSYLSWNFVNPFTPLGLIPHLLALQALSLFGLALAFFAGAMIARWRFMEWKTLPLRVFQIILGVGVILAFGTLVGVIIGIHSRVGPLESADLLISIAPGPATNEPLKIGQQFVWSRDGVLILFPGRYTMVRQASGVPLPEWVTNLAKGKAIRRLEYHHGSVVLIYPLDSSHPAELKGLVNSLDPLLKRTSIWRNKADIIVAPPTSQIGFVDTFDGFFVSFEDLLAFAEGLPLCQNLCVWALTSSSGLPDPERVYLAFYLLNNLDKERVKEYLEGLRLAVTGRISYEELYDVLLPFWRLDWGENEALKILGHWQCGEEFGHEQYVRMLLERGSGD